MNRKIIYALIIPILCALIFFKPDRIIAAELTENTEMKTASTEEVLKDQWVNKDGSYYYYQSDGSVLKKEGINSINGDKYLLDKNGKRLYGLNKVKGKWYYFDTKTGRLFTKKGWKKIKGIKYYVKKGGVLATGIVKIGKTLYGFEKTGELRGFTKPFKYKGKWYRTNNKGVAEKLSKIQVSCSKATCRYIDKHTTSKMSKKSKLRTLFNCLEAGNYVPGCIDRKETEKKDFPYNIASMVLSNGRLNCYGQACTFASFAKELGYEPYVIVMDVDHAVVMIDGKYYDNMGARFAAKEPLLKDFKVYKKVKF